MERRICLSAFAKSGMLQGIQNRESGFLRHYCRADARWAAILARAGTDKPPRGVEHLIADFVQRPAEANPAREIVVDENRRMKRRILHARVHGRTDVSTIAHQKHA